jgi:putative ABC transport system permease protein
MADAGIDTLTVPVDSLVVVTVIAALAGAMAAVMPARRAARLNVLTALVTE